ncbi:MAG: substrate-binding periplasmic protein [Bdellovibrio sp.]
MYKIIIFVSAILASQAFADTVIKMGVPFKVARVEAIVQYNELVAAALKDAGFKMELTTIQTKNTLDMLIDGDVDAISYDDKGIHKHRDKVVSTSFPLIYTQAKVFYRKDLKDFSMQTLDKFHAAIPQNNLKIMNEADRRHIKYTLANNPYHCMLMLLSKHADYCLAVEEVGASALKSIDKANQKIKTMNEAFLETPLYLSFAKKYKKDLPQIEAALKARLKGDLSAYPLVMKNLNKTP